MCLGESVNTKNDMKEKLGMGERATWDAVGPLKEKANHTTDSVLRASRFDPIVSLWSATRRRAEPAAK